MRQVCAVSARIGAAGPRPGSTPPWRGRGGRVQGPAFRAGLVLLFAAVLLLWPAGARPALAHAELIGSEPADGAVLETSPARVQLAFSEPIERAFFAVEVYSAGRERVDRRDARISPTDAETLEVSVPSLPAGIYTVAWRALSIDGHVVRGAFAFSVGVSGPAAGAAALPPEFAAGGAPFGLSATVRWLTYLAAALLVGSFGFFPLVLAPSVRALGPGATRAAERVARRRLPLAWLAVGLLLVLTLVALLLQAADVTGQSLGDVLGGRAITRLLSGTNYGSLWLVRAALVAALLFTVMGAAVQRRPHRLTSWAGVALGAAFLLVVAASGHAAAVPRFTALAVGADWLHLLAGAVWVGGLVQMAFAVTGLLPQLSEAERRVALARLVRRFSVVASISVGVIVVTGLYTSLVHVPTWWAMAETFYGAALSGKMLLVAPLLLLGAVNLFVLGPHFSRLARSDAARPDAAVDGTGGAARAPRAPTLFRNVVLAEVSLAVLVLGVTGILTGLPPATSSPGEGRQFSGAAAAGDLRVTLAVDPNQAGVNSFRVTVSDAQGRPVALQRVALLLDHQDMSMGQREVEAVNVGANRYEAAGGYLSMAGRWQATVRVRRAAAAGASGGDAEARFAFVTGQAPGANRPLFSPARIALLALTPQTALGAAALLCAALALAASRGRPDLRQRRYRRQRVALVVSGVVLGTVGVAAGGTSLSQAFRQSVAVAQPVANPVAADATSLARGQQIFSQSCAVCHGVTGRGDGPAARTLRPPPADLRVHMAAGHTDAQLFDWIGNGVLGTAMPAWKEQLTDEDRWHVINYIRSFAAEP